MMMRTDERDPYTSWQKAIRSTAFLNVMYLPALVLFSVFLFYPFIRGIMISFSNWDGFSQTFQWVQWAKYKQILVDPNVRQGLINTLIYGLGSTIFQNILGLAFALLLDRKIRGRSAARAVVYLPVIVSQFIMGYIWYFFFQYQGGAINDILIALGKQPFDWLANGPRAVWLITGVNTFQYLGVAMIIYLAGLQTIPTDYYESASIDGANGYSVFRHITFPLLMPAIITSMVINIIGGLKLFDMIMAMTKGGPGYSSMSLSTLMYNLYFLRYDAGYAAAVGNLMFVLICLISITTLRRLRRKEVEL